MKKLLLGSIALMLFSASAILFQISCKKEANARPDTPQKAGKILFTKSSSMGREQEVWLANYDGTGQSRVNFELPEEISTPVDLKAMFSPDEKTVFIAFYNYGNAGIYSCNIDGSNMKRVINGSVDLMDVK